MLKISLEGTITDLENHFDEQHKAYKASTDARTESFRKLTKNDAASARIIERRMRKLIRLQDSLVGPHPIHACPALPDNPTPKPRLLSTMYASTWLVYLWL